jgi:hypothetical protein
MQPVDLVIWKHWFLIFRAFGEFVSQSLSQLALHCRIGLQGGVANPFSLRQRTQEDIMNSLPGVKSGTGDDGVPDSVKDAEAAVAALADSFLKWIIEDIEKAKNPCKRLRRSPAIIRLSCVASSRPSTMSKVRAALSFITY